MASFNHVTVLGNLCADPDLSYTQHGKAVCQISIAVQRPIKQDSENNNVDFFDITLWEKKAELVAEFCKKGRQLLVSGYLRQDRWTDDAGKKRYKIGIVAAQVQFLGRNKNEEVDNSEKKEAEPVT